MSGAAGKPRATFRRADRLRRTREFRAAYAARARAADGRLVVYARPNGYGRSRLGCSVGKRCGGAVERNRIKRLLREAFRRGRAAWPPGYDLVVVPLGRGYTAAEIEAGLGRLVAKAVAKARRRTARKKAAQAPPDGVAPPEGEVPPEGEASRPPAPDEAGAAP